MNAKLTLDICLSDTTSRSVSANDATFLTTNYQWAKATDVDIYFHNKFYIYTYVYFYL